MTEPNETALDINTPSPPSNPVTGQHWIGKGYDWVFTPVGWQRLQPISSGAYPEILDIRIDHENKEVVFVTK